MNERQFIIYGAGKKGTNFFRFLKSIGAESRIYGICDRKYAADKLGESAIDVKYRYGYQEVRKLGIPFYIAIQNPAVVEEVARMMEADGVTYFTEKEERKLIDYIGMDRTEYYRLFIAYAHTKGQGQDVYFGYNETPEWMNLWWDEESFVYKLFQKLDLTNVIELACGRGRHVPRYISRAGRITLVDLVEYNLNFCRERFQNDAKVHYYLNNGYNLEKLESGKYTALFSYDSVIHFELLDIWEYLKDIYRVLVPGGRVLIHHSNNDGDYRNTYRTGYQGRAFMSKDIFAYLADRAGFQIVEQIVFDISKSIPGTDCITLLEKPDIPGRE